MLCRYQRSIVQRLCQLGQTFRECLSASLTASGPPGEPALTRLRLLPLMSAVDVSRPPPAWSLHPLPRHPGRLRTGTSGATLKQLDAGPGPFVLVVKMPRVGGRGRCRAARSGVAAAGVVSDARRGRGSQLQSRRRPGLAPTGRGDLSCAPTVPAAGAARTLPAGSGAARPGRGEDRSRPGQGRVEAVQKFLYGHRWSGVGRTCYAFILLPREQCTQSASAITFRSPHS